MKEAFKSFNFRADTLETIGQVNGILVDYAKQGFVLTVRQLYYQLVSRGYIPNNIRSYKRIVGVVGDGRLAGMIDWAMIEDRGRDVLYPAHWDTVADIAHAAAAQFRIDRWQNQGVHIEVMIEKDALAGVLQPICRELDIRLSPNRGYSSLSALYEHAQLMQQMSLINGKDVHLFYLGDHDPSGLDMDRDIADRLRMFTSGTRIYFERLALTEPQIEEYDPPPNPAKESDSRFLAYVEEHGDESWELDALDPVLLRDLVKDAVLELRDEEAYQRVMSREEPMRAELEDFANDWEARNDEGEIEYMQVDL
ncbi:MAG: hypothetical protein ABFD92_20940 [Planctomycetaceae bacterium]